MKDISTKKVLVQNYSAQFWLAISIVAPLFGVCALLSVLGVLPKFPLTENMTVQTAAVILVVCVAVMLLAIVTLKKVFAKLRDIVSNGVMTDAIITDVSPFKRQLLIRYEFTYDGETCKDKHNIQKKFNYKADYSKGKEIKIYARKTSDAKILTVPDIY